MIKKFKPAYWVYNFFQKRKLNYLTPLYKKYGVKKKYYSSVQSSDFKHLESPKSKYDLNDSAQEIIHDPRFTSLDERYKNSIKNWSKNGYAILENFFSSDLIDNANNDINNMVQEKQVKFRYAGKKIMFAWRKSKAIQAIGQNPTITSILEMLMDEEVEIFQSINFLYGSEQRAHSDLIHMTTFPYGRLIAIWVALEDTSLENGPLFYYPGSHKLPYVMNPDYGNLSSKYFLGNKFYVDYEDKIGEIVQRNQLKKEVFLAKKGDVLIWHGNLLHGGEKQLKPSLTRKSVVFHYYAKNVIKFHEITERPSYEI